MDLRVNFLQHAKVRAPLAIARDRVGSFWRRLFGAIGRYRPLSAGETACVEGDAVSFKGDIPVHAGSAYQQQRLHFKQSRPAFETVDDLVVTPEGAGWTNGVLFEKYSASKPGLRRFIGDRRPVETAPRGFVIQSEHIDTFGDWMSEYLAPLAGVDCIDAPVFLPARFASKPYVHRDAARLNIDFRTVHAPLLIEKAFVVRQPKVVRYWTTEDTDRLRKFLKVASTQPDPGSLLYLSRHEEASEVAVRSHESLLVEEIVRQRGGMVLRTSAASLEDYLIAASNVETLLFDHGSAAYNMVYWRPKRVVEFVSDDWWMNSFLFFSDAIGVRDYTIIRGDLGPDHIRRVLTETLLQPVDADAVT